MCRADNLITFMCCLEIMVALTSCSGIAYFKRHHAEQAPYLAPRLIIDGAILHREHSLSRLLKHKNPVAMATKCYSLTHIKDTVQDRFKREGWE